MAKFEGQDRREKSLAKVLAQYGFKSLDEANELLQEFIKLYNAGELDYESSVYLFRPGRTVRRNGQGSL